MTSPSVLAYVQWAVKELGGVRGARVLEVGSYDVNGTPRSLFTGCASYVGMDKRAGPGVDHVSDVEDWTLVPEPPQYDVVVSTEMLEHTPHPWMALHGMRWLTRPGGHLILTTRAPGFGVHDHPADYYRFTGTAVELLLREAGYRVLDVRRDPDYASPGVFAFACKP